MVFNWPDQDDLYCVHASSYATKKQRPDKLHLTDGKSSIRQTPEPCSPVHYSDWMKEEANQLHFSRGKTIALKQGFKASSAVEKSKSQGQPQLLPAAAAQKPNQVSSPEQQWGWRPVSSPTQRTWSRLAPPCHSWMNIYAFVDNLFNDYIRELLKKELLKQFSSQTEMKRLNINDL